MADSNYGNRNAAVQISDDDPFAELTRIMGQLQPTEAAPDDLDVAASEPSQPSNAFDLDLERELMGEFGDDAAEPAEKYAPEATDTFGSDSFSEENADAVPFDLDADGTPFAATSDDKFEPRSDADADDYWSRQQPAEETGADLDNYTPAATESHEPAVTDELLADLDMDFDDLESEGRMPAEEAVAYEPSASEVAATSEVSLEDELEMLLSAGADSAASADVEEQPDEAAGDQDGVEALPEPAQSWHQSIFGRANHNPVREAPEPASEVEDDAAAWDDFAATDSPDVSVPPHSDTPDDPFDTLAHMGDIPVAQDAPESRYGLDDDGQSETKATTATVAPVEVETVDVPEMALAQQDDLDLPDLPLDDEPPVDLAGADLETEFAYDFPTPGMRSSIAPENIAVPGGQNANAPGNVDLDDDDFINAALGIGTASAASGAGATHAYAGEPANGDFDGDMRNGDTDPDGLAGAPYGQQTRPADETRRRTGFMVAGAVLAVAVLGGIGAFALSFGGGDDADVPVLVKADVEPLKVKPENPGGESTVPNQDSVAYEAASGGTAADKPQQESLVSAVEEPVNLASRVADSDRLPGVDEDIAGDDPAAESGKVEDRLDATANTNSTPIPANDIVAVQPRRVRTMIVRPDGTLVPREDAPVEETVAAPIETPALQPAGEAAAPAVAAAEPQSLPLPGLTKSEATEPASAPVATETQPEPLVAPRTVQTTPQPAAPVTPRTGPILPSRPVEQAAAAPEQQVAQAAAVRPQPAVVPAPTATASSEWSMQIASQPSAEGAQATYQELARRYASILDGRGVNIVRAEIPGKGTYYRVRVPSSSRNDGVALCERYKAAGGSCFVSK